MMDPFGCQCALMSLVCASFVLLCYLKGRDDGMLPPDQKNTAIFAILQKFNRLNLVVPVGAPHMWHAAMENKSCKLTTLGEHYRRLAKNNRL